MLSVDCKIGIYRLDCTTDYSIHPFFTDALWSDAELLVVASKVAAESNLKVTIQLNHTELLKTLLMSCGVPVDKHVEMFNVLDDASFGEYYLVSSKKNSTN